MLCEDRDVPYARRPKYLTYMLHRHAPAVPPWCEVRTVHPLARGRAELLTKREALEWASEHMGYVMEAFITMFLAAILFGQNGLCCQVQHWSGRCGCFHMKSRGHDIKIASGLISEHMWATFAQGLYTVPTTQSECQGLGHGHAQSTSPTAGHRGAWPSKELCRCTTTVPCQ